VQVAGQCFVGLERLEGLAAFGGQGQQGARAFGRGMGIAGAQKAQSPGPLRGVGAQAEGQRRILLQQQAGQHLPDAGIGQRLHVGIAQLRAIAAAGALGGARCAVQHGDAMAGPLQRPGRCQADDAGAHDADMH